MTANAFAPTQNERIGDADIYADPLSSSEDDGGPAPTPPSNSSDPAAAAVKPSQRVSKRPRAGLSSPSPRKRLRSNETKENLLSQSQPPSKMNDEWDVLIGSSSQGRKRKAIYGSQKANTLGNSKGFERPPDVEMGSKKLTKSEFVPVGEIPKKSSPVRRREFETLDIPDALHETGKSPEAVALFNMPPDLGPGSASTTASDVFQPFDLPELPSETKAAEKSSSATSPSSTYALDLPDEYKSALPISSTVTDAPTSNQTCCPLCSAPVSPAHLEEFNFGRRMNIRAQQRFCQSHKRLDALASLKHHGYPTQIDWKHLETVRIPKHIHYLTKVLTRRVPSHYRTKLEEAAAAPPYARKGLQKYLREGFAEVVKPGYYGPKGARIMTQEITTKMAEALRRVLKKDKIVRMVEVGGYISAVLVPELTLKLVMEDQGLAEDKVQAGLQVLEESTRLGTDLWGAEDEEDERVLVQEDGQGDFGGE